MPTFTVASDAMADGVANATDVRLAKLFNAVVRMPLSNDERNTALFRLHFGNHRRD